MSEILGVAQPEAAMLGILVSMQSTLKANPKIERIRSTQAADIQ
jgi:hypothetical protein